MRWLLATALLLPVLARADSLQLVNGGSFVGRIVEETPAAVTISSQGASWTFKRERIASMSHDAAEADREEVEARVRNQEAAVIHDLRQQQAAARKRAFADAVTRAQAEAPRPVVVVAPPRGPSLPPNVTVLQRPPFRLDYRWFN
jgi:hypothetical protein